MSEFDQKFNRFLTVENPKMAVADQKLSEAIEPFQTLNPVSFLILKRPPLEVIHADAGARPQHAGAGGGVGNFLFRLKRAGRFRPQQKPQTRPWNGEVRGLAGVAPKKSTPAKKPIKWLWTQTEI
jgi:hypothetical protein